MAFGLLLMGWAAGERERERERGGERKGGGMCMCMKKMGVAGRQDARSTDRL